MTNDTIIMLALSGLVAGIAASFESLLQSTSGTVTEMVSPFLSQAKKQVYIPVIPMIISVLVIGISYGINGHVIQILNYSYELYDSCLVVPLLMSYWLTDLKKGSAIGAMVFGLLSFIFLGRIELPLPKEIVSLALSLLGFCLGHYIHLMHQILNTKNCINPVRKACIIDYHFSFGDFNIFKEMSQA